MERKKKQEKVGQMRKEATGSRRRREVVWSPGRRPWEEVKAQAGVGGGRGADSWLGATVISPTVGRSKAKVSLTLSVEPIPTEGRVGITDDNNILPITPAKGVNAIDNDL